MNLDEVFMLQRRADELHHKKRIEWLSQDAPCWACGNQVSKSDIYQMKKSSHQALEDIAKGIALFHADPRDYADA